MRRHFCIFKTHSGHSQRTSDNIHDLVLHIIQDSFQTLIRKYDMS